MGKASELAEALVAQPLTTDEIRSRRISSLHRDKLVATLNGELVEPAPTLVDKPQVVISAPQQPWD
jgi:hypothetical protein